MKSVISAHKLAIGYTSKQGENVISKDITFEIPKGELIGVIGKNGIGKSTFLRTISGIQPKLNGAIALNNKPLESFSTKELARHIGVVLTERLPESNLTVYELISLGRHPYTNWIGKLSKQDNEIIKKAIQHTQIEHLIQKKYFELSDGQLQKVLIARAIAQDTDIIILDEPTAHLDVHHTAETFNMLKTLSTTFDKTIFVSTHEVNLALELSDTIFAFSSKGLTIDKTSKIVNSEIMNDLFDSDLISFDSVNKQFKISKNV